MLTQHERVRRHTDRLRRHDLVAKRIINHTVLMNTSLMSERIAADDRLVRLHVKADDARKHLTRRIELSCVDARLKWQTICSHTQRHHDLFERRVACALADAVDRTLNLSCAGFDRGETVCNRQTEIVVTVNTD